MTIGTAGNADARALYARMASVTGSIANGFPVSGVTPAATRTAASAPVAATSPAHADTRLSGVGLHLGRVSTTSLLGGSGTTSLLGSPATATGARTDLFSNLRSALAGFEAQTGFDQMVVTQLLGLD